MVKYELRLKEYLTDEEIKQLVSSILGEKDIMLDFPKLWEKMYDYYSTDMPYGTAKARTGDPVEYVLEQAAMALRVPWKGVDWEE